MIRFIFLNNRVKKRILFVFQADNKQVELFKLCIKKLRFKYSPEDFKNPAIQKIWNEIEAIALEKEKPDDVIDLTIPDYERIKSRAGKYLDDFVSLCFPDGMSNSTVSSTKRKVFIFNLFCITQGKLAKFTLMRAKFTFN